jgi:hypothetical protein
MHPPGLPPASQPIHCLPQSLSPVRPVPLCRPDDSTPADTPLLPIRPGPHSVSGRAISRSAPPAPAATRSSDLPRLLPSPPPHYSLLWSGHLSQLDSEPILSYKSGSTPVDEFSCKLSRSLTSATPSFFQRQVVCDLTCLDRLSRPSFLWSTPLVDSYSTDIPNHVASRRLHSQPPFRTRTAPSPAACNGYPRRNPTPSSTRPRPAISAGRPHPPCLQLGAQIFPNSFRHILSHLDSGPKASSPTSLDLHPSTNSPASSPDL